MNKEEKRLLEYAVEELKEIREVQAIYLYGSHATGKSGPVSDIDLCVVMPKDAPKSAKSEAGAMCSDKLDTRLFWELPSHIRSKISDEGELLFTRDELGVHRAMVASIKEYLDFKPLRMRFIRRALGLA